MVPLEEREEKEKEKEKEEGARKAREHVLGHTCDTPQHAQYTAYCTEYGKHTRQGLCTDKRPLN